MHSAPCPLPPSVPRHSKRCARVVWLSRVLCVCAVAVCEQSVWRHAWPFLFSPLSAPSRADWAGPGRGRHTGRHTPGASAVEGMPERSRCVLCVRCPPLPVRVPLSPLPLVLAPFPFPFPFPFPLPCRLLARSDDQPAVPRRNQRHHRHSIHAQAATTHIHRRE
jgi:hypothetical protein